MGNFSKTVSDALSSAEKKNEELTREIGSLEFQDKNSFKAPPKEWIDHRLASLRETLNKDTVSSSLALKELLGEIRLEAIMEKEVTADDIIDRKMGQSQSTGNSQDGTVPIFPPFKPYYVAYTKIQTLALLDEEHKGSNWYHWRRDRDSNPRTPFGGHTLSRRADSTALASLRIALDDTLSPLKYQYFSTIRSACFLRLLMILL